VSRNLLTSIKITVAVTVLRMLHALCLVDNNVNRHHNDVAVTSHTDTSIEPVVAVNHVQPSIASNHFVSRWLLVGKCPEVCCWLENSVTNLPGGGDVRGRINDVMSLCGGSRRQQQQQQQQQQQRSPLTILFGSAVTSTVTTSPHSQPAEAATAPPWRPFSIHEDRPIAAAASLTTTAGSSCTTGDLRGLSALVAKSPVDDVDQSVPRHHTVPRPAVGQQYTVTSFLPGIPLVPVLPDGLYTQLYQQRLLSSVTQQAVDGGFVYPAVVTSHGISTAARHQCSKCGLVFSALGDLVRHQQSSCGALSKSSSLSSSPQSASTGSPPTRSPSPLLSCPHCDKTYTSSGALKMHVRTHTLPCRCTVCGKSFSRPWLLQGHLRTHTGERPFRCTVCGRAFADRSNLRAHSQTHAAAKRYQCTACRRSFSRLSLLVRHERHTVSGCCGGRHGNDDKQ